MAARLRLTLMFHVEDGQHWTAEDDPWDDHLSKRMGLLSTAIGLAKEEGKRAKISMQFDRWYLDHSDPYREGDYPYSAPTSLRMVLENDGNFWCHTHSATAEHLQSVHVCVGSAVAGEIGTTMEYGTSHAAGRSGGGDPDIDMVSVSVGMGFRRANSSVVNAYQSVIESLRPHRITEDDYDYLYFHDVAPGPIFDGPITLRQRPFWINVNSVWDGHPSLMTTYPHADLVGSLMMIPAGCRYQLKGFSVGRRPLPTVLTMDDFNAAMTHLWSTSELKETCQDNIVNAWYIKIPLDCVSLAETGDPPAGNVETFAAWVDSINEMLDVGGESAKAAWANFNEIASLYTNPDSWNY